MKFAIGNYSKVFPAHAGVILLKESCKNVKKSVSRACGGDPGRIVEIYGKGGCFPRMRG